MNRTSKKIMTLQNTIRLLTEENEKLKNECASLQAKYSLNEKEKSKSYLTARQMIQEIETLKTQYEACISTAKDAKCRFDQKYDQIKKGAKENQKKFTGFLKDID